MLASPGCPQHPALAREPGESEGKPSLVSQFILCFLANGDFRSVKVSTKLCGNFYNIIFGEAKIFIDGWF